MHGLKKNTITEVIRFCNHHLVPDEEYDHMEQYPSEWLEEYFSFIVEEPVKRQLGDAFYQARFIYKLMCGLRLPLAKQRGIVKFQIVQYASICEAALDATITRFYKEEAEKSFSVMELRKDNNAVSNGTTFAHNGKTLYLCFEKRLRGDLKRTRIDKKPILLLRRR